MSKRRRQHSDSMDEDDDRTSNKRRTDEIDIEERLEKLILKVGDKSSSSLETNLEGLAVVLEHDINNYKTRIIKILCDCVIGYPEKLTIYSTLVGLLNVKNYTCGGEFLDALVRELKESLKSNEYVKAMYQVLFLADLVNVKVVDPSSLLTMFDNFIEVTLDDNIPQSRSDWYVYAVMNCFPWCGRALNETRETELNKVLLSLQSYLGKRNKTHMNPLRVWTSDKPHAQEDKLDCLWAQLKHLQRNGWMENQIRRPYRAFIGQLSDAMQHHLPQLIPPSHSTEKVYPLPQVVFRMFDYTDIPDESTILPGSHAIERFLIEEQLTLTILLNQFERKDCAAALLSFEEPKIPLNYMILEVVFGQIFRLPNTLNPEIFYHSLILELCKLQPSSMPIVLVQATEMLFSRLDSMNTVCIDRFINWLSYHLSNFQFKWTWEDWSEVVRLDPMAPKALFVRELLTKSLWLSYYKRIEEIVPEDFHKIIPPEPKPKFKYLTSDEDFPGMTFVHDVTAKIRSKCTADEMLELVMLIPHDQEMDKDDESSDVNPRAIEIFTQVLLNLAQKSFSHSFAAIAKFSSVFRHLGETTEGQICILKSMYELWSNHQQMIVVLVNKMLRTGLLEVSSVANWIFSDEMAPDFTRYYVWEILGGCIRKMNRQVSKLQNELEEMRDRKHEADNKQMGEGGFEEFSGPTEDEIEKMEEQYEEAASEQKNLFLIIFQRFIMMLTNHIAQSEAHGQKVQTLWFKWAIDRLRQVFIQNHEQVMKYNDTLESLLFTSDIDSHILQVFHEYQSLRG